MMKNYYFFLWLAFSSLLLGQEASSPSYKEDQLYVDINFILQTNGVRSFQENGFSRSFHLGMIKDMPLTNKGTTAIGLGLGYGYMRMTNNVKVRNYSGSYVYTIPSLDESSLRNGFSFHQLQVPLEFRWRTSSFSDYSFWRIYLGYRLSYQFGASHNPFFGKKFSLTKQVRPWQHGVSIAIGYNTWNMRLSYDFFPVLKDTIRTTRNIYPRFNALQIGLIFYVL